MPLWSFRPVADPSDARWQDHPIWGEVVVEADTSADARRLAGEWELSAIPAPSIGNESPSPFSAFEDEKLYRVQEIPSENLQREIPAAITPSSAIKRAVPRHAVEDDDK